MCMKQQIEREDKNSDARAKVRFYQNSDRPKVFELSFKVGLLLTENTN